MPKLCGWSGVLLAATTAFSQSLGNYGAVRGVMVDTSKASIPSAIVTLRSESTGMERILTVDSHGGFQWNGLPFGAYRLTATARGFADASLELAIRSSVPLEADLPLSIAGSSSSLEVSDKITGVLEVSPTARGTLDRSRLEEIPVQNPATGMSDMVTRTTPGVAADGNGFAHPLGEHADTSFSIDNQPITDQQAKVFSNQISTDIIDIMEVTTGAPAAEFGGKTSLIITVTTRSGLGKAKPFGSISSQYGSFGSWSEGITTGAGNSRLGNFTAISSGGSGRFLDTPEFRPLHDKGNSQALFNRADWQPNSATGLHLNLSAARSWFQTPNTYDSQTAGQDQRSQIRSFNIAPSFSRLLNPQTLFTLNPFLRFDRSQYFPSANPLVDRPATLSQSRYLTNTGFRTDLAWSRGIHNAKLGGSY